ncbi:MAG: SusD/RagB family nutrient-binding outer membrane lipoprotein [Alistipes sp.]|nr:SusD/RagB family nutrient-binding outer membrane lipoprotein [Alistipes sp.]
MKKTIYTLAALLLAVSCTTNFDEYNSNPNQMPVGGIGPFGVIEDAIFDGADGLLYRTVQLNGELIQYTTQRYTENVHRYIIRDSYVSGAWNHLARAATYADEMRRLAEIAVAEGVPEGENALGIALTLRALYVSYWTDVWGEIPFSEAFQGRQDGGRGNTQPKFDTQKSIYEQLLEDLDRANCLFNPSAKIDEDQMAMIRSKDLLYNGDFAKWRKFANSLRLRLLMRLSNRDAEMGVSEAVARMVASASEYPLFAGNDDAAILYYTGQDPFVNRFGDTAEPSFSSNQRLMAENLIDIMDGTDDPRTGIYAVQRNSQWKGLVSGYSTTDTDATGCALMNKNVLGMRNSPYSLMRYDEVLFLLSEAARRGMIPGGDAAAEEYYKSAILASIDFWDGINPSTDYRVTELQRRQFLDKVAYNGSLERILTQKYVALYYVGYEAWCDYRRTGYPTLNIGPGTSNEGVLPTRLVYPVRTVSTNEAHVREAIERQGPDNMRTPVWWSRQAAAEK